MDSRKSAYLLVSAISIVYILVYGQSMIVPFVMGLLLWFVMRKFRQLLDKIPFVKDKVPSFIKTTLSFLIIIFFVFILFNTLTSNIQELTGSYEKYEANVDSVIALINNYFNIDLGDIAKTQFGSLNYGQILGGILSSLSGLIGNTFMILLYAAFVLLEESNFANKIKILFTEEEEYNRFLGIWSKTEKSISNYFGLKAFVSFLTGFLSFIALQCIGVDSPVFWAFLIFILNFIPTIGSLIGTLFPAVFCLLQFGAFWPAILVLLIVGTIQIIIGNIVEPRLMGSSMNISPLVTILALSFWGAIWGITGMIFSVPITVVMILIMSQFESTKKVAILLSESGKVD